MQKLTAFGGPDHNDVKADIIRQLDLVRSKAKQILKALATLQERALMPTQQQQVLLAYTANALRYVGKADRQTLREHVDDETKDTVCKAIAAALKTEVNSTNFKRTGVMSEFASAALDAVPHWSKDDTFVAMVLDDTKPSALGHVIGKLVDAVDGNVKLDIEHAETVVHCAWNCLQSVWLRSSKPSVRPFLSNGLFKAVMHVCNINNPRVNGAIVDIVGTITQDATTVRYFLAENLPSWTKVRPHLEHALEISRVEGSMSVHKALQDLVNLGQRLKPLVGPGGPSASALNSGVLFNMCLWCNKTEKDDGSKLAECPGCKSAHYCSKECQKRDWKTHKVQCKKIQEQSGADYKAKASDMKTVEIQMFNFLQMHGKRVVRKMWEVAKHAEDTRTDLASLGVPGGIERLVASPRLRDYLVSVDFGKGTWSVHIYEAFMAKQDLPSWMLRDDPSLSRHTRIAEMVKLYHDKLEDRVQFLSLCIEASRNNVYCFRDTLFDKSNDTPVITDESVLEFGRDGEAFSFDQGSSHDASDFQNGGRIDILRELEPSSDPLAKMDALRRKEMKQYDGAPIDERKREDKLDSGTTSSYFCRWCNKTEKDDGIKLTECPGCKSVHYCSTECSKLDWKSHKVKCKKLQKQSSAP